MLQRTLEALAAASAPNPATENPPIASTSQFQLSVVPPCPADHHHRRGSFRDEDMGDDRHMANGYDAAARPSQIVAMASHDMLIQSGNRAYTDLYHANIRLQAELQGLKYAYGTLNALIKALPRSTDHAIDPALTEPPEHPPHGPLPAFSAPPPLPPPHMHHHSHPHSHSPTPLPGSPVPPAAPLARSAYPAVRFWRRGDWDAHRRATKPSVPPHPPLRGGSRALRGENVSMQYIESAAGIPVDGHRAAEVRQHARDLFALLAARGAAPKTWTQTDAESMALYRREMRRRVPELALCEMDWKADKVAIDCYPGWYKKNVDSASAGGAKRAREETGEAGGRGKRVMRAPEQELAQESEVEHAESNSVVVNGEKEAEANGKVDEGHESLSGPEIENAA